MTTALLALLLPAAAQAAALRPVVVPKARVTVPLTAIAAQGPRLLSAGPLLRAPLILVPAARLQPDKAVALSPKAPAWRSAAVLRSGFFSLWDGGKELEGEEFAYHEQRKKDEKKELRMERALVDYRPTAFDEAEADEFLGRSYDLGAARAWTGRELLALLLTPHAIVPDVDPGASADLSLFGKSEAELREAFETHGIVPARFHEALTEAFALGLIYRLNAAALGRTLYGVPYPVRKLLGVEAPEPPKKEAAPKRDAGALAASLIELAGAVDERAGGDELLEFAAQVMGAAVAEGVLAEKEIPPGFREKMEPFPYEGDGVARTLLTFLESAHLTGLYDEAEAACRAAVSAGLLDEGRLEKVLREL